MTNSSVIQNLVSVTNGGDLTTTTLAIAEGTGNDHASVIKLARAYLADLEGFGGVGFEIRPFETNGGTQQREVAILNERQATLLISYMRNSEVVREFKIRLVREFYAMAEMQKRATPTTPLLPAQIGETTIQCMLRVAAQFGVAPSYAMQVASQEAERQTGMPWSRLLTQAEVMLNVPDDDVMLEPTELGKLFDLTPVAMNRWLAQRGLQTKVAGEWVATDAGRTLSTRHAWATAYKSGYNLKWKAAAIEQMMQETTA